MPAIEEARREIAKLIAKYERLSPAEVKKYNEANTCKDFLLPLFKALGWDVDNSSEVSTEDKASRGRVDWAFYLQGIPKFFLEAKPLRADLDNPEFAKQVINYAYHKGVTWAVLTGFERLKVFNAEIKETNTFQALFFEIRQDEYLDRFDQLWLLSREAFEQALLDKEALKLGKRIRKTPVGQQLFSDLVTWRGLLHKYLSSYNKAQPPYLVDEAVQRILDRLIFIRTCEDRGIEPPTLRPLVREWRNGAGKDLVQELKQVWRDFEAGYNSHLFLHHLADELNCEPTPLAEIIEGVHATKDRSIEYDFNAIDADVLGGIYEQYLEYLLKRAGEEVEITAERRKRKAQGIYYTPKFVVRYIVENTLGRALEGKSLQEARKITILDPACGSGSFLVEALDHLERHWQNQRWIKQSESRESAQQADFFDYVTKVQFLTENLYGVDLDTQAVEIAQLNLQLKALHQRALLPDLVKNIRQGNSLISGTEEELHPYFGDAWQEKKPFNWEKEFKDIMAQGGFDVVIGNPPYVSFGLRGSERMEEQLGQYLRDKFPNSAEYKLSTYALFIDRGLQRLGEGGYLGYILPDSFLLGRFFSKLRKCILDSCAIKEIVLFTEDFWSGGTIGLPVILILQRVDNSQSRRNNQVSVRLCADLNELKSGNFSKSFSYKQSYFESVLHYRFRLFFDEISKAIMDKLEYSYLTFGSIADIHSGCIGRFGQDSIKSKIRLKKLEIHDKQGNLVYFDDNAERYWQPLLESGSEIGRYFTNYAGGFVYYHPSEVGKRIYAKSGFEKGKYIGEKLFLRQTGDSLVGTYDSEGYFCLNNMHVVHLLPNAIPLNLNYILAILNSKLMNHYYHLISLELGRAMAQTDIETLEQLPIHRVDFDNPSEKKRHDNLVTLVDRMLEMNERLAPIRTTPCHERDELLREIESTDQEIDNLVYDLYGLTEEEKGIVEGI